ncbi:MAG: cyclase family protein [Candidatus Xenobia bacterium]
MLLTLDGRYRVRLDRPIDISIPVAFDGTGPRAFGLPYPVATGVPGVTSCRCETITLTPHGNGTHTECVSHVTKDPHYSVLDALPQGLLRAALITLRDRLPLDPPEAVVLRTLPNDAAKARQDWSGTNPPFLTPALARQLRDAGVWHLVVDLPSVDPEQDGGRLEAHRAFFGDGPGRTITELAYIPDEVPDGLYLLDLQVAPLRLDAAPSRPILYPLEPL